MAESDDSISNSAASPVFRPMLVLMALIAVAVLASFCILSDDTDSSGGFVVNDIWYEVNGIDTVEVAPSDYTMDVVVPETVTYDSVTYRVTGIQPNAFESCLGLTSVSLPSGVTEINPEHFWNCTRLSAVNVNINNPYYSSKDGVVFDKYGLTLIVFPAGKGPSYTIPDGVMTLGTNSFLGCANLTSVYMPNSVYQMGSSVFKNCKVLTSARLSDGLLTIADNAFFDCIALASIVIPDMVISIQPGAFTNCYSLSSVTLGSNLSQISNDVFKTCVKLYTVNNGSFYLELEKGTPYHGYVAYYAQTLNGVTRSATSGDFEYTINTFSRKAMVTAYNGSSDTVTIDNAQISSITYDVINVGSGAFKNNTSIETLNTASGVFFIGKGAFFGCTNLVNINFSDTIYVIDESAFENCQMLTSVTLPLNLHSIGKNAFKSCLYLSSVTVDSISCELENDVFAEAGRMAVSPGMSLIYTDSVSVIHPNNVTGESEAPFIGSLTIGKNVSDIKEYAFKNFTHLEEVRFNSRYITSAKSNLFYNAGIETSGITVNFGESITRVPNELFCVSSPDNVPVISDINFGVNMTEIGWNAFSNVRGLTLFTIPSQITKIDTGAFRGCTGIVSLTLNDGLISIGDEAFGGCSSLISVTIPDTVKSIGNTSFRQCILVRELVIGDDVETIGSYAFYGLEKIKSFTIPKNVKHIGTYAFAQCPLLTEIVFNAEDCTISGIGIFDSDGSKSFGISVTIGETVERLPANLFSMGTSNIITVEFKEGATEIGEGAFRYSSKLVSITLPGTLITIGKSAFSNCQALVEITIPDSVKNIGDNAFSSCTSLSNVNFGSGVETIGNGTFNTTSIIDLTIPDNIRTIGNEAFGHSKIASLTIGAGVTTIGERAFIGCTYLRTINFNAASCADFSTGSNGVFVGCTTASGCARVEFGDSARTIPAYFTNGSAYTNQRLYVDTVTIGNNVAVVGNDAFINSSTMISVTFGTNVAVIGENAFKNCTGLETLEFNDELWNIRDSAFESCGSLRSISFGIGLQRIGSSAFKNCTSLTSLILPDTLLYIGDNAFYGCSEIVDFHLSANLTELGSRSFYNCARLKSVTIPSSLRKVGDYSFGKCNAMSSLTISYGVDTLGTYCFLECYSLETIYIPSSVTVIDNYAFKDCSNLRSMIVPDSVTDFGVTALYGVIFKDTDGTTVLTDPKVIAGYRYDGSGSNLVRSTDIPVIRWMNDSEVLETDLSQKYGSIPTYDGLTPFKDNDSSNSYIFKGWSPEISIVTGSTDYYAVFEQIPLKYYVKYMYDGERYGDIDYHEIGATVTIRDKPVETGYTVSEWATSDITVAGGTFEMPDKCVIFYSYSTVNKYSITFNTDGGTVIPDMIQDYLSVIVPPKDPVKPGYTFIGWDPELPEYMPLDGLSVTAIWSINQYTITFDSDGGTPVQPITQDYKSEITAPADPSKAGYTFVRWDPELPERMPLNGLAVTAVWSVNQYTITFDSEGGTPVQPITQDYDSEITPPADPVKTGYIFAGWEPAIPERMPLDGLTVYAQWTIGTFSVIFESDGGTPVEPIVQEFDTEITPPEPPTKPGYTFIRWDPELPERMPGYELHVTAVWSVNQYAVTFDTNGGTPVEPIVQDYGSTITATPVSEKTGYSFVRWVPEIPETMPLDGITVKAEWSINQYTITFDSAGGSSVDPITQDYNTILVTPNPPVREGYKFYGWNPALPSRMPAEDITLTATWKLISYTIVFDTAGGTLIPSVTQGYGTEIIVPADPEKLGYTFAGWDHPIPTTMPLGGDKVTALWTVNQYSMYFDNNDGTPIYSITQDFGTPVTVTAPTMVGYTFLGWSPDLPSVMTHTEYTYTARWLIDTYAVTFDSAGGSEVKPIYRQYGSEIGYRPDDPVRAGYTFVCWEPEIPSHMPLNGCTVTAQWTPNKYTITFDTAGGSEVAPITQYCDAPIMAPENPTRTGYIFTGWDPKLPVKMTPYDMTVTAQWQKVFLESDIVVEGNVKKVATDSSSAVFSRTIVSSLTNGSEYVEVTMYGTSINMDSESFRKIAGSRSMVMSVGYGIGITQQKILENLTEEQKIIASKAMITDVDFSSYGVKSDLGRISVTFDYTLPEGKTVDDIRVYCVSGEKLEKLDFNYEGGKITLYVNHMSSFAVCEAPLEDEPIIYTGMNGGLIAAIIVAVFAILALVAVFKK